MARRPSAPPDGCPAERMDLRFIPELSVVRPPATRAVDVLRLLAKVATAHGYAWDTFEEALLCRELQFPTGLPTPTPVAIPHTDPEHVRKPGLAVALLDPAVPFGEMGRPEANVPVRLVVLLLISESSAQVEILSRLVAVLRHPDLGSALSGIIDPQTLTSALESFAARVARGPGSRWGPDGGSSEHPSP